MGIELLESLLMLLLFALIELSSLLLFVLFSASLLLLFVAGGGLFLFPTFGVVGAGPGLN